MELPDPFLITSTMADGTTTTHQLPSLTKNLLMLYISLTLAFGGWLFAEKMQNREDIAELRKDSAIIIVTTKNTNQRLDRQEVRMDRIEEKLDRKADK